MFKLHDKTRRFLTLSIFILLGPALLVVVLVGVFSRHSVRTVSEWEELLTHAIGKQVEIESVGFPAPGMVRFFRMRVIAPDTGEVLLQIPQCELVECFGEMPQHIAPAVMSQSDDQANPTSQEPASSIGSYEPCYPRTPYRRGLIASAGFACSRLFGYQPCYRLCEIPEISINTTALPQAKDVLLEMMATLPNTKTNGRQLNAGITPTLLLVDEININPRDDMSGVTATAKLDCITIKNACFELRPTAEQTTFLATFSQADQSSDTQPFRLAVFRQHGAAASTSIRFSSGNNEVPTRMLTGLDPFFDAFGTQCSFSGTIVAENSIDKRKKRTQTFELTDTVFHNVALDSLLTKSLSFRLDGMADKVTMDSVKFRSKRNDSDSLQLESAAGTMINARGSVSWPGLRRLVQGTKLRIFPRDASPPETDITFRDGTFRYQIDSHGILLSPRLDANSQPCPLMVIDNHCAVYWPDPQHIIRYEELMTALSQPNSQQIPLMPETQYLISTLPITIEPGDMPENAMAQQAAQRPRLSDMIRESSEPQKPPADEQTRFLVEQPQLRLDPQNLMDLQPPQPHRDNPDFSAMAPVPSLGLPQVPYRQQAMHIAMGNSNPQPETTPSARRQPPEDSYTPQPQPPESIFISTPQNTVNPMSSNSPQVQQPAPQPVPSVLTRTQTQPTYPQQYPQSNDMPASNGLRTNGNLTMTQPYGIPYGVNTSQLTNNSQMVVAQQPQNRVVLPAISANSGGVQTNSSPGYSDTFNSGVPTTLEHYPTQVATAQSTLYYGARESQPSTSQPSTPSFSNFGL